MDIEYPDSTTLNSEELFAIKMHIEFDKKFGIPNRESWPKWLIAKMDKAVNNPLKGGGTNVVNT